MPDLDVGAPFTDPVRISGERRKRMQDAALAGVRRLLDSVVILCSAACDSSAPDQDGPLTVAGGLYISALAEYGKLLLIESLPEKDGYVVVPYLDIFRTHYKKIEAAVAKLPCECAQLKYGVPDPWLFDPHLFDTKLDIRFPRRIHALYLDMKCDGSPVVPSPPDPKQLARAVSLLRQAVATREAQSRAEKRGGAQPDQGDGQE